MRRFFTTAPQHEVRTDAYLIARYETTYAQWLAFLRDLPGDERAKYLPSSRTMLLGAGISLAESKDGIWSLSIAAGDLVLKADEHQPIVYPTRKLNASMAWSKMPVTGVNLEDANAFVAWLDRTRRVPGARLCTDWEWERAARGADSRRYPHADGLDPKDANIDMTYGKIAEDMGPDEVGLHPSSASPFGVEDMVGNAWTWVKSSLAVDEGVIRGGSFAYDDVTATSINRTVLPLDTRDSTVGIRVCATPEH